MLLASSFINFLINVSNKHRVCNDGPHLRFVTFIEEILLQVFSKVPQQWMVQRMPLMKTLLKHVTPGLVGVLHISITAMWNKTLVIIVHSYDLMCATLKNTHHQISCGTETLTHHCNSSDSTSDGISHSPEGSHSPDGSLSPDGSPWTPASVSGGCLVDGPAPGLALGRGGGISVTNK